MTSIETVVIIHQSSKVLLGMKKVRFGNGKYNGFGGKVKEGETLEEAAIREVMEEATITIQNPEKIGEILFHFQTEEQDHLVYFFKTSQFTGNPTESEEMKPEWFEETKIPYDRMWPSDKYWLPLLLNGKKFIGKVTFNKDHKIAEYKIDEIV